MDLEPLSRVDPLPYQHRLAEVMRAPVIACGKSDRLADAAQAMRRGAVSALLVVDESGRPAGIVTERDLVRRLAEAGDKALAEPVAAFMSRPVATLPPDAFLFEALLALRRGGFRHLVVADPTDGKALGMVSARALLKLRAERAQDLVGDVMAATDAPGLAKVHRALPDLARALLAESLSAGQVAAIIAALVRNLSARAAELAASDMARDGLGEAPAEWCLLVLGSGGRGESLLTADQDNALVHAGATDDDPWFAELGKRVADLLNAAGIPYCRGDVMAMSRECRHGLSGWQKRIELWIGNPEPAALLNADIFYDFRPVFGAHRLGGDLRRLATRLGGQSLFLHLLARAIGARDSALNVFGGFRKKQGRVDLKRGGLFPLVAGGRVLALKAGSTALETPTRWRAAGQAGLVTADDLRRIEDAHEMILRMLLDQQLADLKAGLAPGNMVEIRRLLSLDRDRLKEALHIVDRIDLIVRGALS